MSAHDFLAYAVLFLAAAVVVVPIFKRLGLGSVLGYLFAGAVIGPWGVKLITSVESILHFSEFGVVLLLFLIGLELKPTQLWSLRKPILGMGGSQVVLCSVALALGLWVLGFSPEASLIGGMGFSLSSTAIALQLLREKNLLMIPAGQASFSVLLFQDLAVIPMLSIIPLLGATVATGAETSGWITFAKSIGAILVIVVGGRYLIRPIFRYVARTNLREVFTAFSLLLVFAIAYLMQAVELSMALGTFLAGVLLADSEYRHELEIDIEPFKGLLLGLFFMSVGMSIDFGVFRAQPVQVLVGVVLFVSLKSALLVGVGKFFKFSTKDCLIFAVALSQGGEFAFVLFNLGSSVSAISTEQVALLNLVVALSMATTPFLMMFYDRILVRWLNSSVQVPDEKIESSDSPVILCGYGRVGGIVGRFLRSLNIDVTILDHDPNQIDLVRKFGVKTYYGDVTRLDLLHAAGAERAKILIVAIDDMEAARTTVKLAQQHFPHLKIVARARNRDDAFSFVNLGVSHVRETFHSALEMGEVVLRKLGVPSYEAKKMAYKFRDHDSKMLLLSAKHQDDEKTLISMSRQSRDELARLMKTDDMSAETWD